MELVQDNEKMVECIQEVLSVLAKHYPQHFREDGITIPSVQVMGMLQQLLNPPQMPPGMQMVNG